MVWNRRYTVDQLIGLRANRSNPNLADVHAETYPLGGYRTKTETLKKEQPVLNVQ